MADRLQMRILDSLASIDPVRWDALAGDSPFLCHAFLHALHETGCACEQRGWTPRFVTLWDGDELAGAMPLYLKFHSYGEYVFDWAWADAYHRRGLDYYPKLLCAVPFTPATGPRLLAPTAELRQRLLRAALGLAKELRASSLHLLFPPPQQACELESAGLMLRTGVQFHWLNPGYRDFDDFLSGMSHDKRKKIKQERRRVREAGIQFSWFSGREATSAHWDFFTLCYKSTYRQHHSTPYLNHAFFRRLAHTLPDNVQLIIGSRDAKPVAAALNVHNGHTLWGRYWGATQFVPGLHFETCYYQSIEFCIARGIRLFEGGAQGEHKLARGFLPVATYSGHWLAHPQFSRAVEEFLGRETRGVGVYLDELTEHSPFKAGSS
jgi:predicted N-acyltransferase